MKMWVRSRATPRLRAKASAAVVGGSGRRRVRRSISSCSRFSSACSSRETSPSFAARTRAAKSRIAASAWVSDVSRRNRLGGNRSTRAAHHSLGVLRLDFAVDLDAQASKRAVGGEDVGEIAEGVLMGVEPRVGGHVDAPADHILAFVVARGQPQHLDHARGRRFVAMDDAVGDAKAHVGFRRSDSQSSEADGE